MPRNKRSKKSLKSEPHKRDLCDHKWVYLDKVYKTRNSDFIVRKCVCCGRKQAGNVCEWVPLAAQRLSPVDYNTILDDIDVLPMRSPNNL